MANQRLKCERERRGWSLGYVAGSIDCPDPHTVGRWERGTSFPSPRYRQALCELFGKDAEELGFFKSESVEQSQPAIDIQPGAEEQPARRHAYFFFNEKLPAINEFFGREIERETLLNRTYNRSSTSIVGSRRIGKTWLIEYLMLGARTQFGIRFRIGYLDAMMASCSTVAGFTTKAARELGCPLSPEHANRGLVALEEIVETLRAKGLFTVLCIDEFEGFSNRPDFDVNFFASLRAMTQIGLSLVVASRRPLIDIVGACGNTSGFFNVFEQLTLEPFNRDEAEDFVTTKGAAVGFNEQEQEALLKYGQAEDEQWPPVRLQVVGKMLLDDKVLGKRNGGQCYRPDDPDYWQGFEQRLEEKYRGVVR